MLGTSRKEVEDDTPCWEEEMPCLKTVEDREAEPACEGARQG